MTRLVLVPLLFAIASALPGVGRAQEAPLRVGGDVKPPKKTKNVPPLYPVEGKLFGAQGIVILETTIGEDGAVRDVRVLRSVPLLDWAAVATVLQWRYEPTVLNGQPTPVIMSVTVNYTLGEAAQNARRLGESLLAKLQTGDAKEKIVWPPAKAELELEDYSVETAPDGSREYRGRVRNVSGGTLPDVRIAIVHRETSTAADGRQRESLTPLVRVLGDLDEGASREFSLQLENDGSSTFEKVVLLFGKSADSIEEVLIPTRGARADLGGEAN